MDPNETLDRIRKLCRPEAREIDPDGSDLSDHVEALDEWLTGGGSCPRRGSPSRTGTWTGWSTPSPAPGPPLGPPNPAHADGSLLDQLDDELHRAGEIVRRMKEEH
jgi:hypothetical protein